MVRRLGLDLAEVYGDSDPANLPICIPQYRAAAGSVHVVNTANSASTGTHTVTHLMVKNNKFLALEGDTDGGPPILVFSYDDGDTFIDSSGTSGEGREVSNGEVPDVDGQEDDDHDTVGNGDSPTDAAVEVEVVIYNADGTSVFRVIPDDGGNRIYKPIDSASGTEKRLPTGSLVSRLRRCPNF